LEHYSTLKVFGSNSKDYSKALAPGTKKRTLKAPTKKMPDFTPHPASYRDPSGFVFRAGDMVYRQVNTSYAQDYQQLMDSGLYESLIKKQWLIPHSEIASNLTGNPDYYTTLLPQQLPFLSYPCEWSPDQLKAAALLTLDILRFSIDRGMVLKDATPINIQFPEGRPMLIDSLSFERYDPSRPWVAYRQFCECFLYPLLLHHYHLLGIHKIFISYPEGIPAQTVKTLLPPKSRFRLSTWLHVLLPARIGTAQTTKTGPDPNNGKPLSFDQNKLRLLADNLEQTIRRLRTEPPRPSGWSRYYTESILSRSYLQEKERLFREMTGDIEFASALDLGANDGHFSSILAEKKSMVVAIDSDWACVGTLYRAASLRGATSILPLCVDIADPTPASGFFHAERPSFTNRFVCDLVAALALVHHLVLQKNIPLGMIAEYLAALTHAYLIIEFIPVTDEKAKELLRNKTAPHHTYDLSGFQDHFKHFFSIEKAALIPGTERVLFLMKKNKPR
jgi:hypothetical protein